MEVLELQRCETQEQLHGWIEMKGTTRAGSTIDPRRRRGEYRRIGYRGTMYYAATRNMHSAENRLFDLRMNKYANFKYNDHAVSNSLKHDGFVYLINGRRLDVKVGGNEFTDEDRIRHREIQKLPVVREGILIGSLRNDMDLLGRRWTWYNHEGYNGKIHYAATNDTERAEIWLRDRRRPQPTNDQNGDFLVYVFEKEK